MCLKPPILFRVSTKRLEVQAAPQKEAFSVVEGKGSKVADMPYGAISLPYGHSPLRFFHSLTHEL